MIDVDVEKLVFRGDGLARSGGIAVFIPFAAPGDRLRVRVTEIGRGFARGEIVEVLQPGPSRRDPSCRHFGACGGCRLQHVAYDAQLEAKVGFVRESLRRLGGIDWTSEVPIRSAAEFGWRTRAEIQARRGHVGYFREGTHEIVDVAECPILAPAVEAFVLGLANDPPKSAVHVAVGDDGVVATGHGAVVRQRIAGFDFEFGVESFFQANRLLVDELVREAVSGASGGLAVDLYAGAGLFSLPLARTFGEVVAVEAHGATARRGAENAARNSVTNVRFVADSAENWVAQATSTRPDLVLLDPPRTGVGPRGAEAIAKLGAPNVTYVSCDPATLARDLQVFVALGYRLASVVALDMFPQTYHVETAAKLVR
jgi:23S rRNA (uracil1939-C5)-methyltransferase